MNVDVLQKSGKKKGKVTLDPSVFAVEPNMGVMHQAVKRHLANRRQGTHKTKERAEVRGGGRKPWRQKGRGVARAGTIRSPLWVGGGTIFGPRPHSYRQAMPKKMRRVARRSALTLKAQSGDLFVVDDLAMSEPKTSEFAQILKALKLDGKKVLALVENLDDNTYMACRNLANCLIMPVREAATYDLINANVLLIEKAAIDTLNELLSEELVEVEEAATSESADSTEDAADQSEAAVEAESDANGEDKE